MSATETVVIAREGTPDVIDVEAAAARLRTQQVAETVEASTQVFGDDIPVVDERL